MLTACIRRSIAANYRFSAIHHEDYIFWRNIILDIQSSSIKHIPEPLAIYNIHTQSLTANKLLSLLWLYKSLVFSRVNWIKMPFYLFGNILFRLVRFVYSRLYLFNVGA